MEEDQNNFQATPITQAQPEVTPGEPPVQPPIQQQAQPQINQMVTPTPMQPLQETKKKGKFGIVIAIVAIVIILLAAYFLLFKPKDAKTIINGSIDKLFNAAIDTEEKIGKNLVLDYKKQIISTEGTLSLNLETNNKELTESLGDLSNIEINYGLVLNAKGQELSFNTGTKQKNKDILNLDGYIKDKILYLKANIFEHPYKLDVSETVNWDDLKLDELPEIDMSIYQNITEKLKEFIKDSISKEYLKQEKGTFNIEGVEIKGYKNTLEITEKRLYSIELSIYEKILNDKEFIKEVSQLTTKTEEELTEEIKDSIENDKELAKEASNDTIYTINIYTTGIGKFIALEFIPTDNNTNKITAVSKDDITTIKIISSNETQEIKYNEKAKEFKTTIKSDDGENIDLTLKLTENGMDLTLSSKEMKITANFSNKTDKSSMTTEIGAGIEYTENTDTIKGSFGIKVTTKEEKSIKTFDISKATLFDQISQEESDKINSNLEEQIKGTYIETIVNAITSLFGTYSHGTADYSQYDNNYNYSY